MNARVIEKDGVFAYETTHRIFYNTKSPVPIKDVITSLQGLERLLLTLPTVVSGITGIEIEHSEFTLQSIESGSLTEDILIAFFFKDKAKLDSFIQKAGENKMVKGTVVAVALAGIVGYGMHWAASGKPSPNITANNNVIINIGAGELQLSPDALKSIVASAVNAAGKKEVAQNAIKFLAPARNDPESSVVINPDADVSYEFKAAAIAEAPSKYDAPVNERFEELIKAEVLIRATDLDSKKTGWAGKIEDKTNRVRIELDPTVSEAEMFGKSKVTADATLFFAPRGKGEKLTPVKIFIRKIYH